MALWMPVGRARKVIPDSPVKALLTSGLASLWRPAGAAGRTRPWGVGAPSVHSSRLEKTGTMWKTARMLVLASASAARNALLKATGLRFVTSPAQIDERALEAALLGKGGGPADVARALADAKAIAVSCDHKGALVIGADQVLALGDSLLHKPKDRSEALAQLGRLAGRTHRLLSAVALVRDDKVLWRWDEAADLTMRSSTPAELSAVLDLEGEAAFGAVGGYRLEGPSIRLFERIEGDYFAILGLPLLPLLAALRRIAPELLEPHA